MPPGDPVLFGPFRLDSASGILWRGSETVPLTPKAFALLHDLVQKAGRLRTREELLQAVWPETPVGDGVLKVCMSEVRRALGDEARSPRYIATVHRRGYRFIGTLAMPGEQTLTVGMRLGPYEVVAALGAGGMGEVYRARDTKLEREVAIKVLSRDAAQDEKRLRRFITEAKAASALNHPHILTIYAIGEEGGRPYIVSELVAGRTLRELLRQAAMPASRAVEVAIQVLSGLAKAHAAGIVHRDLKPENVMVSEDGFVKVLDFGVAKLLKANSDDSTPGEMDTHLTEEGQILGTVAYMSPEQARGQHVDARSDLFSVGILLHELITGVHPFRGRSGADTMAALVREEPFTLALSAGTPGASPELVTVVEKALRKNVSDRWDTAAEMEAQLRAVAATLPEPSAEEVVPPPASLAAPTPPPSPSLVTPPLAVSAAHPWRLRMLAALAAVVGLMLVLAHSRRGGSGHIDSLAVLPFDNPGQDPETEYLSEGITESLIYSVSQLPDLKVISRSSVFAYKGRQLVPRQVAQELRVRAVLLGRIVQRGDSVTISAELVDAQTDARLWGEHYTRKLVDIPSVQAEIAREISDKLRMSLSGEARRRLGRRYTDSAEAYRLYLKGRFHWNRRTDEAVKKSIEHFEQAIEKDPAFALPYAGLADAYGILGYRRNLLPREAWLKGKAAARKALEIDDSLAEAHTFLAFAAFTYDWDFTAAEREFRRALELSPSYAHAHHWHSHYLMAMGRTAESMQASQRALELDPLDLPVNTHLAWHYYMARDYEAVVDNSRKVLEMDPGRQVAHLRLGDALERQGRYAQAGESFRKALELTPENTESMAALGHAHARAGEVEQARRILDQMRALARTRYVSSFDVALIHLGLDERDQALEWLRKAHEERATALVYLKVDPRLDTLRGDPRFQELLRLMGLGA